MDHALRENIHHLKAQFVTNITCLSTVLHRRVCNLTKKNNNDVQFSEDNKNVKTE